MSVNNIPYLNTPNGHGGRANTVQPEQTLTRSFYENTGVDINTHRLPCHSASLVLMSRAWFYRASWPEYKKHVRKGICGVAEEGAVVPAGEEERY